MTQFWFSFAVLKTQLENVAESIPKPFIEVLKQIPATESSILESQEILLEPGSAFSGESIATYSDRPTER